MYDYRTPWKKRAMALSEAKSILGFPPNSQPTDDEVNRAYRSKYIENRKLHPDTGGDPREATKLNVAKDTLQQRLRPDRVPGQRSDPDPSKEDAARRKHDEWKKRESKPVPDPPGGSSLRSALPSGVDWKVLSNATYSSDWEKDDEGDMYQTVTRYSVAFGKASGGFVAAQIKQVSHSRSRTKAVSGYTVQTMSFSSKTPFLKVAPKAVKEMIGKWHRRPKFRVLEGDLTEKSLAGAFSLSLKDAIIGSGLVDPSEDSSLRGRKIQVEIEPILDSNKAKEWRQIKREGKRPPDLYTVYDWYLYVNGKQYQLSERELKDLKDNHLLAAVYGYDYEKGRKNLSKLRGGRMSAGASEALRLLSEGLRPGPVKDAVQTAAEQAGKKKASVYNYDRRVARQKFADAEDITPLLIKFREGVKVMADRWREFDSARDDGMTVARARVALPHYFNNFKNYGDADTLFWGILQQYRIASAKDRKLIEKASKEFSKTRMQSPKRDKALETFKKKVEEYTAYLEAADRIVRKGELHSDEGSGTTESAGCFTLVNTGGFDPKQMGDVSKVVEKATQLIKSKGFGKICYGNIQVTNTVGRSASILAFYVLSSDELFVRGNLRGKQGPALHTVIHELGHRLHYKFLKSKDAEIKSIYKSLLKGEDLALKEALADKSNWPQPGHTIKEKSKTFVVDKVDLDRSYNYVVRVHLEGEPEIKGSLPLRSFIEREGKTSPTFVSNYAKKDHSENFAEMFAHYVQGTLDDGQAQVLEALF